VGSEVVTARRQRHWGASRPDASLSASLALFAYGSLASGPSAEATLGRPVHQAGVVRLAGWRRRWSQVRDNLATEKTFADAASGAVPPHCIGLNVEPDAEGGGPNGVLIAVSEAELERLDTREIRYRRVDVTGAMRGDAQGFDRVETFTAKPENFAPTPPAGAVVLAPYLRAVEAAFGSLGADQLELFHETTGPVPVDVIEPVLVRDEIPPGNPRDW
jgi:cation transport regulator ChaC